MNFNSFINKFITLFLAFVFLVFGTLLLGLRNEE